MINNAYRSIVFLAIRILLEQGVFWGLYFTFVSNSEVGFFGFSYYLCYSGLLLFCALLRQTVSEEGDKMNRDIHFAKDLIRGFKWLFFYLVLLLMFLGLTKDVVISRTFFIALILFLAANGIFGSLLLVGLDRFTALRLYGDVRMLLFGPVDCVKKAVGMIIAGGSSMGTVVGYISDDDCRSTEFGVQDFGRFSDLDSALKSTKANCLIVVNSDMNWCVDKLVIRICNINRVRVLVYSDVYNRSDFAFTKIRVGGANLMSFREEPLQKWVNRLSKRVLDIAISLPIVLFAIPLLSVVVWFFQRFQSPGTVFYRQERSGLQGKTFKIVKFRTMDQMVLDPAVQAVRNDIRVYPFGRFIRRMSIDEIPQFINVLFGEMSLIGPRPHLAVHDRMWSEICDEYNIRYLVKPGITGLAQIRGFRGEVVSKECITERVRCDLEYIENWSIGMDLYIIIKTIIVVARPTGNAY